MLLWWSSTKVIWYKYWHYTGITAQWCPVVNLLPVAGRGSALWDPSVQQPLSSASSPLVIQWKQRHKKTEVSAFRLKQKSHLIHDHYSWHVQCPLQHLVCETLLLQTFGCITGHSWFPDTEGWKCAAPLDNRTLTQMDRWEEHAEGQGSMYWQVWKSHWLSHSFRQRD